MKQRQPAWNADGPTLPIEFARQSRDGRLTLVIVANGEEQPVLWAEHSFHELAEARANLCEREWHGGDPCRVVGVWQRAAFEASTHVDKIDQWARYRDFDAVIWTKLPPRFNREEKEPSAKAALEYLRGLSGKERPLAEEYVRRTPRQIRTPLRKLIEVELGWLYDGSLTDLNIAMNDKAHG